MNTQSSSANPSRWCLVTTLVFAAALVSFDASAGFKSFQKISDTVGGFTGQLDDVDDFGNWVTTLRDVDGITDIAVAAKGDDDGGINRGGIWILFLKLDGSVRAHQKISSTAGGFSGQLDNCDCFGCSLEGIGDFDDDGVPDLAAGTQKDDDGGKDHGAVWLLMLNPNGTVKQSFKISDTAGGFTGGLNDRDDFGQSVEGLGDLDGDGINDMVVTADADDDGGRNQGAAYVFFLLGNGSGGGNQPPVISAIGDRSVVEESVLSFTVNAQDPNGDDITLTASGLPIGADFLDHGNGTGDFE